MGVSIELSVAASCKLFKDSFFRDRQVSIHSNDKLSSLDRKMNNKTSSVMVPRNCKLVAFTGTHFEGAKQVYHENTEYVGQHFDDKISSAKCKCNNGNNNHGNNNRRQCVVFRDPNFQGRKLKISKNQEQSYVGDKMNNKISSVRVPDGCKLITFNKPNFYGNKHVYKRDRKYIGDRYDNKISSLICRCNADNNSGYNNGRGDNYNNNGNSNYNNGRGSYTNDGSDY